MKLLKALVNGMLRSYPGEFRRRYRDEILQDVEAEPDRLPVSLLKIVRDGFSMRIEGFVRDLRYAVGRLRRAPLFVAIVTLTFALGIGANVAVFSVFNAVLLRPLPFPNADRLVTIGKGTVGRIGPLTALDVSDLRARLHGVDSISGIIVASGTMSVNGTPKALRGANVSATFFRTIHAVPEIGRLFEAADGRSGQHAIVISNALWRSHFNADLTAIGKRMTLDGTSYVVVGVTRAGAEVPEPSIGEAVLAEPDYFTVIPDASPSDQRRFAGAGILGAVAELQPGTTLAQLNAELLVASSRVQALYPHTAENARPIIFVAQTLSDQLFSRIRPSLWMVFAVVVGILLAACANVSNVIGARWSAREREVAVRRALGASSRHIAVQLFVETGILAACGCLAGIAGAYAALRFIPLTALGTIPRANTIAIDGPTLLYALVTAGLTTVLAGFVPVLSLGRTQLQLVLNTAGRGGDSSRGRGLRSALVVAEVAIALAVVVSSGLLVRSLITLLNAPLGFAPQGIYLAPFPVTLTDNPKRWPFAEARQRALLARVGAVPGFDAVAIAVAPPLTGAFGIGVPGIEGANGSATQNAYATSNGVSPGYFRALAIPVLRGRAFVDGDSASGARVAIVSQGFAERFLPGDPLGKRIRKCPTCSWLTVVGVVWNVTQTLGQPPLPIVYTPVAQHPPPLFSLIVRAPHANLPAVRKEIRSAFAGVYPDHVAPEVYTVADIIALTTRTERFAATLLGLLSVIPLLLAVSGIYGVVSFSVTQRSREFGIRVALGARTIGILVDVVRRSLATTALGVAIGIVLAALNARAIAPYLTAKPDFAASFAGLAPRPIVSPFDPLTFAVVIALIFAAGAVAALIPALRATQVDPVVALRYE